MSIFYIIKRDEKGKLSISDQDEDFDELHARYQNLPEGTDAEIGQYDAEENSDVPEEDLRGCKFVPTKKPN